MPYPFLISVSCSVVCDGWERGDFVGREARKKSHTVYPQNQIPLTASPIRHSPVPSSSFTTLT